MRGLRAYIFSILMLGLLASDFCNASADDQGPGPILNATTYDGFLRLQPHLSTLYSDGTSSDLDRYLRSLVRRRDFDIQKLEAKVLEVYGPAGLIIPADADKNRVADWNKSLMTSGFGFLSFESVTGRSRAEPPLSSAFTAWMWGRKLVIPTAVFIAAYGLGIYELPGIQNELGYAAHAPTASDFMAPVVAAGVAGAFLSAVFEFPRRWWDEEIFGSRFGALYQQLAFLLIPMGIRATEIVAILKPWERETSHLPLSTAFWIPALVSSVASTFTVGYSNWKLNTFEKRGEISKFSAWMIGSIVALAVEVGRVMYLTGHSSLPGLTVLGSAFLIGSVPLAIREYIGRASYEQHTAFKAWRGKDPKRASISQVRRLCGSIVGRLSMALSPSTKSIQALSAE